jgi:hypothetical protein
VNREVREDQWVHWSFFVYFSFLMVQFHFEGKVEWDMDTNKHGEMRYYLYMGYSQRTNIKPTLRIICNVTIMAVFVTRLYLKCDVKRFIDFCVTKIRNKINLYQNYLFTFLIQSILGYLLPFYRIENLSAQKSRFSLPKNVLAWVLCHLVGGAQKSKTSPSSKRAG